jgi:hypothetical protein
MEMKIFLRNFKEKIFKFAFLFLNLLELICLKIKDKIVVLSKGKCGSFNFMLYGWGLAPALFVLFFLQRRISYNKNSIFVVLVELFLFVYFTWHFYTINKTLKVQPQYKVIIPTKKELYKDKTPEEIKEIKKQRKRKILNKFLLKESWSTTPNYSIIRLIDIFVAWSNLTYFLQYIKVL